MAKTLSRTERFTVLLTPAELKRLEAWARKNRIKHTAEAARRLMEIGLATTLESSAKVAPKQLCEAAE